MPIFKRIIAAIGLTALLFGLVMLVGLIALGGGLILNGLTQLGQTPATALFLGSAALCSLIVGFVSINDHLRKISWISQEDDDWEWDAEDPDEVEIDELRMPATGPGRNQPCPCGSGKKYKRCCLKQNKLSNAELNDIPF